MDYSINSDNIDGLIQTQADISGDIYPSGPKGDKGDKGDKGEKGDIGVSPIITISKEGKITTITITDINGEHIVTLEDGVDSQGDMLKSQYDTNNNGIVDNAEKINGHSVETDVPQNAVFTDTVYDDTEIINKITATDNKINKSTDEYSSSNTYSTGDLVIYNNKLYKASQDITTAEEFNSEHWTETSITAELGTRLEFEEVK